MAAAMATEAAAAGHVHQQQLFRVVDTALVAPAAAAGPALPPRSIPLTFFDVKWLHLPPVERVLLYRLSPDADVPAILSALRTSLSQALRAFYPMAGHVRMPTEGRRHELSYSPGDAVPFTTAEYDVDIDHLIADDSVPVQVAALAPLVPRLPKGRAVLAVQATLLLGRCRGLAVGVTVHHTTCDGAGSTHFLHTWAAAAGADEQHRRQVPPPQPPVIDRELIPDPRGLYDIYLSSMPPMVSQDDFEFVLGKHQDPGEDKALATFTLSQQLLQSIKSAVADEAARRGMVMPPRCSSILATYGFIWSCYCQVRRAAAAAKTNMSYFLFSVDQRSRLKPPVPDKYFGNCCCPAIATAPTDEVAAGGMVGLFAACAAVEEEVREGAQERWDACVVRVKEAVANGTLSVAGSPRFRVYDLDFGFGRPAKVDMVSVAKTGAISVADARAGGGVEVGISLPAATGDMDRFRHSVADGMAWLLSSSQRLDHSDR
ncbi:malonyl-CoA:anthocyanidin 5-O-glucoside-6''-O-malonyltransferase-like [Miscanthus floridulus]|uniref:malonyl-CoA:anthocyanidin 5-O-glucoside-6''-O-malonyltransferase-like n=2 Tax=Miscanthus floridulus TaxID=154761 RepID=UPI0034593E91